MKHIPLSRGKIALVDDEDYERVSQYKWSCLVPRRGQSRAYASRGIYGKGNTKVTVYMHRFIMNAPKGTEVDHINGDGLDNRRANLRLCTRRENARNSDRPATEHSPYKGVFGHPGSWSASITTDTGQRYLGAFTTAEEAAYAYDVAAKEHHGEFARPNGITQSDIAQAKRRLQDADKVLRLLLTKQLRARRKALGITQRELGSAFGLGHTYVSRIERGHIVPREPLRSALITFAKTGQL